MPVAEAAGCDTGRTTRNSLSATATLCSSAGSQTRNPLGTVCLSYLSWLLKWCNTRLRTISGKQKISTRQFHHGSLHHYPSRSAVCRSARHDACPISSFPAAWVAREKIAIVSWAHRRETLTLLT